MHRLALIGMSGSGKSHWSERLAEYGFTRFCCDDLITGRLDSELRRPDGTALDLGQWMGLPYEPGYAMREAKYLALEVEVLEGVLEKVERSTGDVVVDTTGSVIYTGQAILNKLHQCSTVVHFSTPPHALEKMLYAYLEKPRPVLWQGMFTRKPHETNRDALVRCYPLLLAARERLYKKHADLTLEYSEHKDETLRAEDLLRLIDLRRALPG